MSKALVIAEKPSVAADIARALGRFEKKDDAFENDQYVISSAVGHLVELALPPDKDVKRGKWTFAALPVIPDEFDLNVNYRFAPPRRPLQDAQAAVEARRHHGGHQRL